jgi:drug/metabolite transporter (DMT)-like permease
MPLALPLIASFLYAFGSWGMKLGLRRGAQPRLVNGISNLAMAGWSAPLVLFFPGVAHTDGFWGAFLAGAALFFGRACAIRALAKGDLSLATPVLGMKTIFVALLSVLLLGEPISPGLMAGAVLSSLAVALLSLSPGLLHGKKEGAALDRSAAGWALLAAFFFGLTDIIVQRFAKMLGVGWFQPLMFATLVLLTPLLFLPEILRRKNRPALLPGPARAGALGGSVVIGFQTSLVVFVIGFFGHATATNVVYATRGLWAILLEGALGGGSAYHDKRVLAVRLTGAALLLASVALAVGSL